MSAVRWVFVYNTDCSVCSEEYALTLSFTCIECVDSRGVGVAIMAVLVVFSLCAIVALFVHLVSGEEDGARKGIIHRVTRCLPLQSIKIVVVVWQILTQVRDTVGPYLGVANFLISGFFIWTGSQITTA